MTIYKNRKKLLFLIFAAILGIFIGWKWFTYKITFQSIWLDEAATIDIISSQGENFWKKVYADKHPPFYYYLLKKTLSNYNLLSTRKFSAFCVTLTLLLLILFYRDTIIILLFLSSPFIYYFAQEGRMYALVLLLSFTTIWILEKICLYSRTKQINPNILLLLLIIFLTFGNYTHYYFLLLSGIAILNIGYFYSWKKSILITLILILLYIPWFPQFLADIKSGINWNPSYSIRLIPVTIFKFILGYSAKNLFFSLSFLKKAALIYFLGSIFLLYIWKNYANPKKLLFYGGNFILGLIVASISAITFFKNSYLPKYLIVLYPFFLFIIYEGMTLFEKGKYKFITLFLLLIYTGICLNSIGNYFSNPYLKGDWTTIFAFLKNKNINKVYLFPPYLDLPFKATRQDFSIKALIHIAELKEILVNKPRNCAIIISKKVNLSPKFLSNLNISNFNFLRVKILF